MTKHITVEEAANYLLKHYCGERFPHTLEIMRPEFERVMRQQRQQALKPYIPIILAAVEIVNDDIERAGSAEYLINKIEHGSSWMPEDMIPLVEAVKALSPEDIKALEE